MPAIVFLGVERLANGAFESALYLCCPDALEPIRRHYCLLPNRTDPALSPTVEAQVATLWNLARGLVEGAVEEKKPDRNTKPTPEETAVADATLESLATLFSTEWSRYPSLDRIDGKCCSPIREAIKRLQSLPRPGSGQPYRSPPA